MRIVINIDDQAIQEEVLNLALRHLAQKKVFVERV